MSQSDGLDLIIRGGRVIDPSQSLDGVHDVGFSDGEVTAVEQRLESGLGCEVIEAEGAIVTPGLIDLHAHVYWGGTSLGIDAERYAASSGVTTLVDVGSSGAGNFAGFRKHVIERSRVRILPFLHVSFAGIFGFDWSIHVGESEDLRLMAPAEAVKVGRANADMIHGVKVRVGRHASGVHGDKPLRIALEVAEELGLPLMAHIDEPPPSYEEVLALLRRGDILTHAFRPFPNSPALPDGGVKQAVWSARERGILFDIGHGMGSFAFETARKMLANEFYPDTISSDVHKLCIDGPAFDLLTTMSKFLLLGMPLGEVVRAATQNPARAVRRSELGTLRPGSPGDASVLRIEPGEHAFDDVVGERVMGGERLRAQEVVVGGRRFAPGE